MINLNDYLFNTLCGDIGVDFPDVPDSVLDYFTTREEALDFLKKWMDDRYPDIKYTY